MLDILEDRELRDEARFAELRRRGYEAARAGRLDEAEAICVEAIDWAREHGDQRQLELAMCNRAAVTIYQGRGACELPRLREILVRNTDPVNCRLAAYNISRHYELTKDFKKSLFYARIALERAEAIGRRDWVASTQNHIGNVLLAESFVDEAAQRYDLALALMPEEPSVWRARILDNLGYCRVLKGRCQEGYPLLYESLAMLRFFGAELFQVSTLLDLCFAHIETRRYGHALRRGRAALDLAEKFNQVADTKNALYLLGEASHLNGDAQGARFYFTRLQRDYFPEAGYLPSFLLTVDIRKLVNLHA